jgi:NADPH-dependent 2,4-dienoyl-CoA reductase/sulfur reductase-like enzyme
LTSAIAAASCIVPGSQRFPETATNFAEWSRYAQAVDMSENNESSFDVEVVGGGAAGLSAALVLGRARRRVAVVDAGSPRERAGRLT